MINAAKKPYILAGHGILISGAQNEFRALVEKTGIPVASTLLGLSAFPATTRCTWATWACTATTVLISKPMSATLLIAVGMRFDDRVTGDLKTYARQARVIHIEIDPSEIDKNVKATVPINADAKEALNALLPLVQAKRHDDWLNEFKECDRIEHEKVIEKAINPSSPELKMSEVVHLISEMTKGEAIVVTDVGQHQMATSRYYKYRTTKSNITSGGLGTMGFALPAAMGSKIGQPDREVIAIIGDGGFQMTLQELGTIFQFNIGCKIVILNNSFLGMVRQWQQLFHEKRYSCTEMTNPNFVAIAKGFNIEASKVADRDNIKAALQTMLDHQGAVPAGSSGGEGRERIPDGAVRCLGIEYTAGVGGVCCSRVDDLLIVNP